MTASAVSEQVAAEIAASLDRQGALTSLGVRLESLSAGQCTLSLPWSPAVTQQHGYFHGGVIGMLADSAGGYACNSLLMPQRECLTAEYKINIVAPADGETLVAHGRVLKAGKTLVISAIEVFIVKNGEEKLCAIMQQTLFAIDKK